MVRVSRDGVLRSSWLCLAVWLGAQLTIPMFAAAQSVTGAPRVTTLVDACVPIDVDQFHRVLAIELGTSIEYAASAAQQPDGTSVRIVCAFADAVQLQLEDYLTRKSMQRVVELPAIDLAARTRLLALSVAEFVVASWVELKLAESPLQAAGPALDEATVQQARQVVAARLPTTPIEAAVAEPGDDDIPHWHLGVSFEPVVFSEGRGLLPQLSLHLEQRPTAHLWLGLALSLGYGHWRVRWPTLDIGSAQITSSSGRVTFGYLSQVGMMELALGAGARGGVVYMAGQADNLPNDDFRFTPLEIYAPWGGPLVLLAASGLVGAFRISVELEAGYVTLPAQALIEGSIVAQLQGFWGALGLGVGWLF